MSDPDKPFETARAVCALNEVVLVKSADDRGNPSYLASRWALTREFASIDDVLAWLTRMTGRREPAA